MTGKGSAAKLHHYVPQAYLRGFATEKGRINVVPYDRSRKPFVSSVKNVAAQTHFYTVDGLAQPDEFEKSLSVLEANASEIIRNFESGKFPPSETDRELFSYYLAIQTVRGPDTRKTMESLSAQMTRLEIGIGGQQNLGKWIRNNLGIEPTPEQERRIWEEATQPGGPPITLSNLAHIQYLIDAAQELVPYIMGRPWVLARFHRRSLITSDAPVSLIRNPRDEEWQGVGFATAWGISFPINRKLGLLMNDPMTLLEDRSPEDPFVEETRTAIYRGLYDRKEHGSTAMEKLFNEHTVSTAREYVYHHPEDAHFVPSKLPKPSSVNLRAGGLANTEFNGEPWFGLSSSREVTPKDGKGNCDSA